MLDDDRNAPTWPDNVSPRKGQPLALGVFAYFPNALRAVSECSRIGNDKHSPGEALHWKKDASVDDADAAARHLIDAVSRGPLELNEDGIAHVVAFAWRALAFAERALTGDDRWRGRKRVSSRPMRTSNVPHSSEFFEQMQTCREAYQRLAIAFASVLAGARSVLDFGCGTGAQTAALARLGFAIVGVDPLVDPQQVEPGFLFIRDDPIRDDVEASDVFDVVICTETAEHIYPDRADALIASVCRRARARVLFSAARPGQEWEGHVNCQPLDYWIAKFAAHGFEVSHDATAMLRATMIQHQAQHSGAVENFVVLDRAAGAGSSEAVD